MHYGGAGLCACTAAPPARRAATTAAQQQAIPLHNSAPGRPAPGIAPAKVLNQAYFVAKNPR
ncbi:exported hypothetical protein [Cupriavidus taiwanensis]|nr:exported hypothetical protein [Cupriavidus taiwanensis]SOY98740.1 exported hypothetical protein [Cupriavidus taiwanensis]